MSPSFAVIFDKDGVLFDTERLCMRAWAEVGAVHGFVLPDSVYMESIGKNYADTKTLVLDAMGSAFPYEAMCKECALWRDQYIEENGVPEKRGVHELLSFLQAQHIPVALGTSSGERDTRRILERAGLSDYFSAMACGTDDVRGKPYPDIFFLAMHRLETVVRQTNPSYVLKPENCIVFEDSPAGLCAAATAGMRSIFVRDIASPSEELLAGVWRQCPSLLEAIPLLKDLCAAD